MGVFTNLSSFKSREYSMIQDQYDAYIKDISHLLASSH
jgi:hypothetical protein